MQTRKPTDLEIAEFAALVAQSVPPFEAYRRVFPDESAEMSNELTQQMAQTLRSGPEVVELLRGHRGDPSEMSVVELARAATDKALRDLAYTVMNDHYLDLNGGNRAKYVEALKILSAVGSPDSGNPDDPTAVAMRNLAAKIDELATGKQLEAVDGETSH